MRNLNDVLSNAFSIMIPKSVLGLVAPASPTICTLKIAAVRYLIDHNKITTQFDVDKFGDINTIEQLEFYLIQYQLTDIELLNIYREAFSSNGSV